MRYLPHPKQFTPLLNNTRTKYTFSQSHMNKWHVLIHIWTSYSFLCLPIQDCSGSWFITSFTNISNTQLYDHTIIIILCPSSPRKSLLQHIFNVLCPLLSQLCDHMYVLNLQNKFTFPNISDLQLQFFTNYKYFSDYKQIYIHYYSKIL